MKTPLLAALFLLAAPFASATEINVGFSEEFAEDLAEEYGEREGAHLTEMIERGLEREFEERELDIERVDITIIKAKPNRPTFKQLGDTPGLSATGSISIGGMSLTGTAYDADGEPLGEYSYKWFENDIRFAGLGTWSDARRAANRFAWKFADQLASEPTS